MIRSKTRTPAAAGSTVGRGVAAIAAMLFLLLAIPEHGSAQKRPDFLFRTPVVTLTLHAGYAVPSASSDVFDFTRTQLTVERNDFHAPAVGAQLAVRASDRIDVALDVGYADSEISSEFRDWVGTDDLPIVQTTEFYRLPVTVGVKAYLGDRGKAVGRFAWIPAKWTPYVGGAAGFVWYRFAQSGEFVDFETSDIFTDRFISEGNAPTVHLFAGADWSLAPRVFLTTEGRYAWAKADLSRDFSGFDKVDLDGFQATAGIAFRF